VIKENKRKYREVGFLEVKIKENHRIVDFKGLWSRCFF